MQPSECMKLLELGKSASLEDIKRAYRRLAQKVHPDKNEGDDNAETRFIEITAAYRTLLRAAQAAKGGKEVGVCHQCLGFGQVFRGLDGHIRCPQCTLQHEKRRLLPLPVLVVVKCVVAISLIAAGAYMLIMAISTGSPSYAVVAFIAGLGGLISLAHTCLRVIYCTTHREQALYRSLNKPRVI